MPGWLIWHDHARPRTRPKKSGRSKKAGLTPAVERTLREQGIRHFDDDLLKMPIAQLREHFGFATTTNLRIGPFFRNVIWQLYERIQAGDLPEFYKKNGMIRGMWYHIKTPISRYKSLRGDRYNLMLDELATLVRAGLVTYKDFNFRDKDKDNHRIGFENSHIILMAEKDGFITMMEDFHALYGVTVITLGGDPSLMTANFLVTDMRDAGVDLTQEFICFGITDFDPDGEETGRVFTRHLRDSGVGRFRPFSQYRQADRDHLDLIVPAALPPGIRPADLKYLLKPTVRKEKAPKWVKLTGGVPGLPPRDVERYGIESDEFHREWIIRIVEEALTPHLHISQEVVKRRATMTQLEKQLKDVILYKVLHPEADGTAPPDVARPGVAR
jgi:hypothetical protein